MLSLVSSFFDLACVNHRSPPSSGRVTVSGVVGPGTPRRVIDRWEKGLLTASGIGTSKPPVVPHRLQYFAQPKFTSWHMPKDTWQNHCRLPMYRLNIYLSI